MKKRILVLAAIFGASASFAQVTSLKSKKGFEILPEAGDYAIQFDATPMLNFGLNAVKMGAVSDPTHTADVLIKNGLNQTIVGKYFKDASTAYRGVIGINTSATSLDAILANVDPTKDDEMTVTTKTKQTQIILGGGMEWRRGHNRLQGFYGAEAMIMIGSPVALPAYQELSTDLETATTDYGFAASYISDVKGSRFAFGLNGIAGVEYFVLPKISLGAGVSWGLMYNTQTKVTVTTETYTGTEVETDETVNYAAGSNFGFGVMYSGNIFATFHF